MAPKQKDETAYTCWLAKAEPDTRYEKGIDISFSVDKFEQVKVTSWEGVRSHEAKRILGERMKMGHKVLFYASNTKIPGVAALAKVVKEGYPDFNAWDPKHPYYDPKSDPNNPTWMMCDVEFVKRLPHFVPLKLLQALSTHSTVPECISYITQEQLTGIKNMALLNRGRLSVQPVHENVYEAVVLLGTKGGWDELIEKTGKKASASKKRVAKDEGAEEGGEGAEEEKEEKKTRSKRKKT